MKLILDTYNNTGNLHHGYCLTGNRDEVFSDLITFLEGQIGFKVKGNPDFWHKDFESFGIDDSREIKAVHSSLKLEEGKRIFIIKTNNITREAQNALLKIFEEPGFDNHFFIILPSHHLLLPTLLSRLIVVENQNQSSSRSSIETKAELFLKSKIKMRLEIIKEILENEDGAKSDALDLVSCMGKILRSKMINRAMTSMEKDLLVNFFKTSSYVQDQSSSVKMILEHLAVSIPLIK